jgi:hypothetical protein
MDRGAGLTSRSGRREPQGGHGPAPLHAAGRHMLGGVPILSPNPLRCAGVASVPTGGTPAIPAPLTASRSAASGVPDPWTHAVTFAPLVDRSGWLDAQSTLNS